MGLDSLEVPEIQGIQVLPEIRETLVIQVIAVVLEQQEALAQVVPEVLLVMGELTDNPVIIVQAVQVVAPVPLHQEEQVLQVILILEVMVLVGLVVLELLLVAPVVLAVRAVMLAWSLEIQSREAAIIPGQV